jgi:murein DD-endopeptidase MepM/ murein hydrolase activator NlpD
MRATWLMIPALAWLGAGCSGGAGSSSPSIDLPPVVAAGADAAHPGDALVALTGAASDPEGGALTLAWIQLDGPPVELAGADTATPTFRAPAAFATARLEFGFTATDAGGQSATDTVVITVDPMPEGYVPVAARGVWPIGNRAAPPDCVQDGFGHRVLGGGDDLHPGWDTCDDNPLDVDGVPGNDNDEEAGFDVHLPLAGSVTRVRPWDPAWTADPDACPSFCRQGNFLMLRHPQLEPFFGNRTVQSIYMHLAQDSMTVAAGDALERGTVLGKVGKTGNGINTVHLHFGLLVGSAAGLIDDAAYVNPLHALPYERAVPHGVVVLRQASAAAFDPGECAAAEQGGHTHRALAVQLVQRAPALDTVRIEVVPEGRAPLLVDFDRRIGVGRDSDGDGFGDTDFDDFEQGCVAIAAESFDETAQDYALTLRFGGDFDGVTRYVVRLVDVRGAVDEREFVVP